MITYKFRLYPNNQQQTILWSHANKLNQLYNYFLNQKIESYKNEVKINRYNQQKELVSLKEGDPSLKEIYSQVLQQVPLRLQNAFDKFFKIELKKSHKKKIRKDKQLKGFPKFRSCKKFFGICYPQSGFKICGNEFITKAYGRIKFVKHRNIEGNIKQVYIKKENNKWYICITSDFEKFNNISTKPIVDIDVGITNIIATSDGKIIKNKNHVKYFDKQINELKSRRDILCKKNSRRWRFLSEKIQKLYDVKNRKQKDFLHKISYNLSHKYDTIIVENLNLKKMSESRIKGINREMRNSSIGTLISFLKYKCNHLIEVNPYNTSKTCNNCGRLHNMPLNIRTIKCECGYMEDRDINAAKNILCLGQAIVRELVELSDDVSYCMVREATTFR